MGWLLLVVTLAALAVVLAASREERRRWRWREESYEARLRECQTRLNVFERALGRLRADYDEGKLELSAAYRGVFERLTSETRVAS